MKMKLLGLSLALGVCAFGAGDVKADALSSACTALLSKAGVSSEACTKACANLSSDPMNTSQALGLCIAKANPSILNAACGKACGSLTCKFSSTMLDVCGDVCCEYDPSTVTNCLKAGGKTCANFTKAM